MELLVKTHGQIYDITGSCTELSWSEALNNGAGSLDVSYISDGLIIENGDIVRLSDNNGANGIFMGRIFTVSGSQNGIVKFKAYDQLRYTKTKAIIVLENGTLKNLVQNMCTYLSLSVGTVEDPGYILDPIAVMDKSWLDQVIESIYKTYRGMEVHDLFCLRDEYGSICLWNMRNLQLPLVLGDDSLCTGYTWKKSIDGDFYNLIKIGWGDESAGQIDIRSAIDPESAKKYGILQLFEISTSIDNAAKAQDQANKMLEVYNHEEETLELECFGDLRIRAGNSFYGSIDDISLNRRLIVQKVTHNFLPIHTMSLEVMTGS